MRDPFPVHGPVRAWYWPWRIVRCRCGLESYPCKPMRDGAAAKRKIWPAEFNEQRTRRGVR